jgi:molecular chaperone DnaJ
MAMQADYYELLGLDRSASEDEVRRAYRRMAKDHHPDLNPEDTEADTRFKEINEAYEVLRDPQKRAMYDRFGHAGVGRSAAGPGVGTVDVGDLGSIFEQFFGFNPGSNGGRGRPRTGPVPEPGGDLRTRLKLSFEQAVFGATVAIEIQRRELCEACEGSGAKAGTGKQSCPACSGAGQVRHVQQSMFGSFVSVTTCRDCGGRGEIVSERCPECAGKGRIQRPRKLDVDVPAGVDDGNQIRLNGQADHGLFGGPPGDLYVVLEVEPHAAFEREGNDLLLQLRLNAADAALGTEVSIPTLEGPFTLKVPGGTQSGDTLALTGKGVPHLRRHGRGDILVIVEVPTPERLSAEQKRLYEQLRASLPVPQIVDRGKGGSWWDRVRQKFAN